MKTTKFITLVITVLGVLSCTDEYSDLGSGNQLSQVKDSRSYSEALILSSSVSITNQLSTY